MLFNSCRIQVYLCVCVYIYTYTYTYTYIEGSAVCPHKRQKIWCKNCGGYLFHVTYICICAYIYMYIYIYI